jgi:hypothetical protein
VDGEREERFGSGEEKVTLGYELTICRLEQQEKLVEESRQQHLKLQQGKVSFRLPVPKHIPRPPYVGSSEAPPFLDQFQIQDAEGIERMQISGKLAARVRDYAGTLVKVNWIIPPSYLFYSLSS